MFNAAVAGCSPIPASSPFSVAGLHPLRSILLSCHRPTAPILAVLLGDSDPALKHQLSHILHLLYVVAAVLVGLLVISVGIAFWAYHRSKEG